MTLAVLGIGLVLLTVLVVLILGQFNMSGEMRGIVIGALLVALAGVIGQLVTAGVKSWQDREQHARDTADRHEQWSREDKLRQAQWDRENQLAVDAERRVVAERIWERRANAYDQLLVKLSELRETAQKGELAAAADNREVWGEMNYRISNMVKELLTRNLYWSDATLISLHEFGTDGANAWRMVVDNPGKSVVVEYFATLRKGTRSLEDTVRVQGQIHLGDRRPDVE